MNAFREFEVVEKREEITRVSAVGRHTRCAASVGREASLGHPP